MYHNDLSVVAYTEYNADKLRLPPGSGMKMLILMKISPFFISNSTCYLSLTRYARLPNSFLSIVLASIILGLDKEESKSRRIPLGHKKLVCIPHDNSDLML